MIHQLKKHYGAHFIENRDTNSPEKYDWFQTEGGNWFGIERQFLTQQEKQLLLTLFPVHSTAPMPKTKAQKQWQSLLFDKQDPPQFSLPNKLRFIHFTANGLEEADSFTEALTALFSSNVTIVWEDEIHGIVIEQGTLEETENIYHTAEALMSDFLIKIAFYIGTIIHLPNDINDVRNQLRQEQEFFKTAKLFRPKQTVYQHTEVLPYVLFQQLNRDEREKLIRHYLKNVLNDKELLESIQVYLECSQNVSMAAKKVFIHRNSLQYRVDKFIEKTGIDVRTFTGGITVYLVLLMQNTQN